MMKRVCKETKDLNAKHMAYLTLLKVYQVWIQRSLTQKHVQREYVIILKIFFTQVGFHHRYLIHILSKVVPQLLLYIRFRLAVIVVHTMVLLWQTNTHG